MDDVGNNKRPKPKKFHTEEEKEWIRNNCPEFRIEMCDVCKGDILVNADSAFDSEGIYYCNECTDTAFEWYRKTHDLSND